MTAYDPKPTDFVLMERRVFDHATRHGFELVKVESRPGDKWWRWLNQGAFAGWFRTQRDAAYWMHGWLARHGYSQIGGS